MSSAHDDRRRPPFFHGARLASSRLERFAVKVCGITREQDAALAMRAGADYLGLVFAESPRRVSAAAAAQIVGSIPDARWVGVFGSASVEEILSTAAAVPLARVQLYGPQGPEQLEKLGGAGLAVWKVIGVDEPADWAAVASEVLRFRAAAEALILDRRTRDRFGGSGSAIAWNAMPRSVTIALAEGCFGVAGGLGPENVAAVVALLRPDLVDASSGLESAPGVKDPHLVASFVHAARGASRGVRSAFGTG